jgi:hypothetical protein
MRVLGAGRAMSVGVHPSAGRHTRALCGLPMNRALVGFTTPEQDRKNKNKHPLAVSSEHNAIRALHGTPANQNAALVAVGVGVAALGVRQLAIVSRVGIVCVCICALSFHFAYIVCM